MVLDSTSSTLSSLPVQKNLPGFLIANLNQSKALCLVLKVLDIFTLVVQYGNVIGSGQAPNCFP